MHRIGADAIDELAAIDDADELCRLLLGNPAGWGRSTRHTEAVELLTRVHGTGELPFTLAVVLVCTCRRWDRVTAKLIAAIHDSRLLENAELDELADVFLAEDHAISYPLAWASPQWLEIDLHNGTGRTYTVTEDTPAQHHVRPEPPLRRWAARHALHTRPERLTELLSTAEQLEPRHRDAAIHGLLDTADLLDEPAGEHSSTAGSVPRTGACASPRSNCSANWTAPSRRDTSRPRTPTHRCGMATAGRQAAPSLFAVMSSPRPKPSPKLLDAMIEEATVDAYNDEEQITGLFTMLEEHLTLPFNTEMLGITVTVTKIDLTVGNEIVAICRRDAHKQAIPILDLPLPTRHRTARNGSTHTAAGAADPAYQPSRSKI